MSQQQPRITSLQDLNNVQKLRLLIADMLGQIQGKKVMESRRRRAAQLVTVGVVLTLISLLLDVTGVLRPLESWFYDQRCYYFQFMLPKPTENLVHLDIDESAIQAVNKRWPWPRELQAEVLREISIAKPKVLFLDIIYPEADDNAAADEALASAMKQCGNILAPVSLNLEIHDATNEFQRRLVTTLMSDLRKSEVDVARSLGELDKKDNPTERFSVDYSSALRAAVRAQINGRLEAMPDATYEQVRAALLPGIRQNQELAVEKIMREQLDLLKRERALMPFTRAAPSTGDAVLPRDLLPPLTQFSAAAKSSGFVDFIPTYHGDSKVRFVPLFVNLNNRLLPHVSLAMACAYYGVGIDKLRLEKDRLIIPLPAPDRDIEIPIRELTRENGQNASYVTDIPWFGDRRWETMYDVPAHVERKQHVSLGAVINILDNARRLQLNVNYVKKDIVGPGLINLNPDLAKSITGNNPDVDDLDDFIAKLKDAQTFAATVMEDYKNANEIRPEDKDFVDNFKGIVKLMPSYLDQFANLRRERSDLRDSLRRQLGNKVVLMGFTVTGLMDQYPTSIHALAPGIVAHGALVNAILTHHMWSRAPDYYAYLLTIVLGFATTFVGAFIVPWKATIGALLTIGTYVFLNGFVLFDQHSVILGVAGPMLAMATAFFGVMGVRYGLDRIERAKIQRRFSNYVDPEVVNYITDNLDQTTFAGEERNMSVVFTDLEGFTTLSERLGAGTVAILNEYASKMVPIIRSNRGLFDKFIGDGIMFEFNAINPNPTHAVDAVTAVMEMQAAMLPFNASLVERTLPTVKMRAGITTGKMIVGDAGGGGASNFTVLGDNVNLAARLEAANKAFGSLVLISQDTLDQTAGKYAVRPMARLRVKGKDLAVMTYEPLCLASDLGDKTKALIALCTAVFDAFVAGDFEGCMKRCDVMDKELGEGKYAALYRRESRHLLAEGAGPDFDGTVTLTTK